MGHLTIVQSDRKAESAKRPGKNEIATPPKTAIAQSSCEPSVMAKPNIPRPAKAVQRPRPVARTLMQVTAIKSAKRQPRAKVGKNACSTASTPNGMHHDRSAALESSHGQVTTATTGKPSPCRATREK